MGETPRKAAKCPICTKPAADRYRPFCSRRCADVDLARWLGGTYRIPDADAGGGEPNGGEEAGAESFTNEG